LLHNKVLIKFNFSNQSIKLPDGIITSKDVEEIKESLISFHLGLAVVDCCSVFMSLNVVDINIIIVFSILL